MNENRYKKIREDCEFTSNGYRMTAEQLAATGAVTLEQAKKIVELREQLGSFQSYEDLQELELPDDTFKQLQYNTTISGIAADCNC